MNWGNERSHQRLEHDGGFGKRPEERGSIPIAATLGEQVNALKGGEDAGVERRADEMLSARPGYIELLEYLNSERVSSVRQLEELSMFGVHRR